MRCEISLRSVMVLLCWAVVAIDSLRCWLYWCSRNCCTRGNKLGCCIPNSPRVLSLSKRIWSRGGGMVGLYFESLSVYKSFVLLVTFK